MTMTKLPGVIEGGMSGKNGQRKLGTTRGSPRRSRTAKASRISRQAAKSRCACEWGAWGRLSEDGSGQHNPNPSEDPWGCLDPTRLSGELGLRPYLEKLGHELIVTSDKDGPDSEFENSLPMPRSSSHSRSGRRI